MVNDIVPGLYEDIKKEFENRLSKDPGVADFRKKMKKGTARMQDVSTYAGNIGDCAVESLRQHLTVKKLPDGRLYWNIAERTVKPILELVHLMINDAAKNVQEREDKRKRIGLKPIEAAFPEERVHAFLNAITKESEEEENIDNG